MKKFGNTTSPAGRKRLLSASLASAFVAGAIGATTAPAAHQPISSAYYQQAPADPAFQQVWARTDQLVQATRVSRSFYWGWMGREPFYERYDEGQGGKHLVQYFDKARMEINDPNGNKSNPFYVTNGQLSREMVTGRMQVGSNTFIQLSPAEVDIASDTSDTSLGTPTYATFHSLIRSNPGQVGRPVTGTVNRAGQEGNDAAFTRDYNVSYAYYEPVTQNNIPGVFWDFLNITGPVTVNGQTTSARLSDPYFYATGYPISAAYWAKTTIAGKPNTSVLIQVYERRVLTYVPSAPEGWRVQMGNVGLHYVDWRYGSATNLFNSSCEASGDKTGQLWFQHPEIQQWLGCVRFDTPERGATVAHQRFEHGEMLDVAYGSGAKSLFILFDDGTSRWLLDTYRDGSPEPDQSPPPGMYAPKAGFGKVWREMGLQARIGWALAPETVATFDPAGEPQLPTPIPTALPGIATRTPAPPAPPAPTAVPPSGRGFPAVRSWGSPNFIIYTGPALHKFYVIHDGGTRWAAYEDALR